MSLSIMVLTIAVSGVIGFAIGWLAKVFGTGGIDDVLSGCFWLAVLIIAVLGFVAGTSIVWVIEFIRTL